MSNAAEISYPKNRGLSSLRSAYGSALTEDERKRFGDIWIDAIVVVISEHKCSASMLQRRFHLSWPEAAAIVSAMERAGIVGPFYPGTSSRMILQND